MKKLLPILVLTGLTGLSAQTVYFSDNFESDTVGSTPSGWTNTSPGKTIVQDTGSPFGANNKYVELIDSTTGGQLNFSETTNELEGIASLFSFDYYEPTSIYTDTMNFGYGASDINSSGPAVLSIGEGSIKGISAYSMDTDVRIFLYVNDTAENTFYSIGDNTNVSLAASTYNLWVYDYTSDTYSQIISDGTVGSNNVERFGFRVFNAATQQAYIDNVNVSSIPEPSTYALGVASITLLLAYVKRRSRK
ncbi:hypothetical protein [Cerasicoccus maritimus]|uniref:hypothetical protein n=1 Tax=Cerasicoccus maritimus TaxID=490089 RepID=UPI00285253CA|nr:hypothetical protein [Cerasicoccus maritimus]